MRELETDENKYSDLLTSKNNFKDDFIKRNTQRSTAKEKNKTPTTLVTVLKGLKPSCMRKLRR